METNKIEDLLLRLLEDMAYVKAKLDNIEGQEFGNRIDALEAQNREHDHAIKALENRANKMEEFTRNNMVDTKKQQNSIFISVGMAIFSAILSVIMNLI
jgi:hypothetical protein